MWKPRSSYRKRRAFQTCSAICALLLVSQSAISQSDQQVPGPDDRAAVESPIVPVHHEPHHRQVFQFGPTRILDLQIPPGDLSWFHSQSPGSDWSGGAPRSGRPERPPQETRPSPRATSFTGYFDNPTTHRIQNIGDSLFRAMVVVNETAGNDMQSVEQAGFDGEPELTNAWFRSYRVSLGPGESTDRHEHESPVVILQAIDGRGKAHGPMDFEFNEPGQWAYYDRGVDHSIENLGKEPIELLEIEVRLP
jgi:mannose-6-phosphate isomerase-like protein (cupin superfamily)